MEVLPQAQAAGQKTQQDAQLGQGSFFDFGDGGGGGDDMTAHRDLPVPPLPDERSELNALGEGDARAVPLEPPAQGGARRAARQGGLLARRAGREKGRRLGHRRRHDRRVQAHPHQEGRPDDVRHARRPRGPGRDAHLQLRLREERGQGGRGPGGDRARPRGPQGGRARRSSWPRRSSPSSPPPRRWSVAAAERRPGRSSGGSRCTSSPGVPEGFLEELREVVGTPSRRPRAAARGGRAAPASRATSSGCPRTAPAAASWAPCAGPPASSPDGP